MLTALSCFGCFLMGGVVASLFFLRTQTKLNATLDVQQREIKRLQRTQRVFSTPLAFIDPPFTGIPRA